MRMRPTVAGLIRVSGMLVLAFAFGAGCATPETSGESGTGGTTGSGGASSGCQATVSPRAALLGGALPRAGMISQGRVIDSGSPLLATR